MDLRSVREIEHSKSLAALDTELVWGWGTPAGKIRAKRRANLIAEGARLGPGVHALEIGCGTGMFTEMFAETGARLVAVEISPDLLKKTKIRKLSSGQVEFLQMHFEDYDREGYFDAVIGSSILHHLDLIAALSKIYNLLKPGGVISFAEPNLLNPQVFAELRFRKWFPYVSPDETAFIHWRLKNELIKAGFEDIEVMPFDWLHPSTPELMINSVKALSSFLEKVPFLRNFAGSLYMRARRPKNR